MGRRRQQLEEGKRRVLTARRLETRHKGVFLDIVVVDDEVDAFIERVGRELFKG